MTEFWGKDIGPFETEGLGLTLESILDKK